MVVALVVALVAAVVAAMVVKVHGSHCVCHAGHRCVGPSDKCTRGMTRDGRWVEKCTMVRPSQLKGRGSSGDTGSGVVVVVEGGGQSNTLATL